MARIKKHALILTVGFILASYGCSSVTPPIGDRQAREAQEQKANPINGYYYWMGPVPVPIIPKN